MRIRKVFFITFLLLIAHGLYAQQISNFSYKDLNNSYQSFEELKGEKLTLIDFWASWCKPCKKAIKELNKISVDYQEKGVKVIGINCDGPRSVAKVKPLTKVLKIKYPILLDLDSELMKELNLSAFPSLIIVNDTGKILWIHEGFQSGDEVVIKNKIDKLLSL